VTLPASVTRLIFLLLFRFVPLLITTATAIRLLPGGSAPVETPGLSWLAMPIELAVMESPLRGWPRVERETVRELPPSSIVAAPTPAPVDPEPEEFAIEVHGQVGHGDAVVYCFFDTNENVWFRMGPGDSDPGRKLSLEPVPGKDGLQLVDQANGRRYRVDPGQRKPEPMYE
jgi:hypothetical protein